MERHAHAGELAIDGRGIVKRFGAVVALDELDVSVGHGEVVGYLGPNGAGKSTTIRILLDLARADAGTVRVLGRDPATSGPDLRAAIGYLPGELRLDDRLRVDETLRSWATLRGGADGGVDDAYVASLCERLDLDVTRRNRHLSSGNRRKVGLVGAFMARPDLLILDEPTAGIDPLVQAEFLEMVDEVRRDGRTVFLSSHVLSEVERIADRVVVIRSGRVVADGSLDELRREVRQRFVTVVDPLAVDGVTADLAAAASVSDLSASSDGEIHGAIDGSPAEFLAVLARHPVNRLVMPEPDLERAVLDLYDDDGDER